MTRFFVLLFAWCVSGAAFATVEDGDELCRDGIDNDFDGLTDCAELACRSSRAATPLQCSSLPGGPIRVVPADEEDRFRFDTVSPAEPEADIRFIGAVNRAGDRFDLLLARSGATQLFRQTTTASRLSYPANSTLVGSIIANALVAVGPFDNSASAGLVAVNGSGMQRYLCATTGACTTSGALVSANPGPAGGKPAVMPGIIAVANTRLRLYGSCTHKLKPFPSNETFGAGNLCSSVDLPGTAVANRILGFTDSTGRHYVAIVTDNTRLEIYEARRITQGIGRDRSLEPILIHTLTLPSAMAGLAFTSSGDLLALSVVDGRVQTLRVNAGVVSAAHALQEVARPRGPLGELAWSPDGQALVVDEPSKQSSVLVVPIASPTSFDRRRTARASYRIGTNDTDAVSVLTGQFNDDGLWDIAVLTDRDQRLRFIRQQPPPCATFITAAAHGMISNSDVYDELARFNRRLADEVVAINAARRSTLNFRNHPASSDALCPVRFIDVRGHWEDRTALGAIPLVVSRGAFLGSMVVPAPICWGVTPPPFPAPEPFTYWASALFLLTQSPFEITDCPFDAHIISDPATRLRFAGAALGFGAELLARSETEQAPLRTARDFADVLNGAVIDADAGGDNPCTHKIFIDLLGHSRGGAMVQRTIPNLMLFSNRWRYNLEVSHTILDGVDPLPVDTLRPFATGGHLVNDPIIRRHGSEWISSFWGNNSADGSPLDTLVFLVPPYVGPAEFRRSSVVGMPNGRDRQAELENSARSFAAFQGPISSIRHRDFAGDPIIVGDVPAADGVGLMWIDPDNPATNHLRNPSTVGALGATLSPATQAPRFAFVNTSHLGRMMETPRGELPDAQGLFDHLPTAEEEEACLPASCSSNMTACQPQPQPQPQAAAAPTSCNQPLIKQKPWIHCDNAAVAARELVPDYDLRVSAGVVESAKRVVTDDPGAKTLLPGALTAQRTWVTTTASSEFPTGGVWRRSGDVRLKSTPRDPGTMLRPYVAYPSVNFSPQTRAEADAEALDLKNALFGSGNDQVGAQVGEPQASRINSQQDVVDTLSFANGGLEANPSPPYALFGASGSLWAPLKNVSLEYGQLFVRVEYQLLNTSGNIAITLEGMKLNASTRHTSAAGMGVRTAEWTVFRNATVDKRINEDRILIQGRNVKVFSVSVRPTPPIAVGNTSYEFVVLDTGVTPQTAALLAARHRYRGKSGALATQLSPSLLASLNQTFWPEVPAWVAASSPTGAAGSFSWQGGGAVDDNAWRAATSFAEPRPLGAHAYTWPSTSGTALGHNGPAVARAGASFGFWVQYATVAP